MLPICLPLPHCEETPSNGHKLFHSNETVREGCKTYNDSKSHDKFRAMKGEELFQKTPVVIFVF